MPEQATGVVPHIRWMIRRDIDEVLAIERQAFGFCWSEDDFVRCLRQPNGIGIVAEHKERLVGFMVYELDRTKIHLLNFAVASETRRRGVGTQMIARLKRKLSADRRTRVVLEVRETNLPAQLFFRSMGFRSSAIRRNFYDDSDEDAYEMRYCYGHPITGGKEEV